MIKVVRYDLNEDSYYKSVKELAELLSKDNELTLDFYQRWTERKKEIK